MIANDNTTPAVSIVVPCRNEKDHIEEVLQSILAQEVPPGGFEVIVADGLSDDGTRAILIRMAGEDSRLSIVDNPSAIVSTALNAAIRVARGLASGKTVEDIATDGGTSRNTIRTHVRGVLEKTGCNRQADIVALLTAISATRLPNRSNAALLEE